MEAKKPDKNQRVVLRRRGMNPDDYVVVKELYGSVWFKNIHRYDQNREQKKLICCSRDPWPGLAIVRRRFNSGLRRKPRKRPSLSFCFKDGRAWKPSRP